MKDLTTKLVQLKEFAEKLGFKDVVVSQEEITHDLVLVRGTTLHKEIKTRKKGKFETNIFLGNLPKCEESDLLVEN